MLRGEETAKVTELFNFVFLIARAIAGLGGKKEKGKSCRLDTALVRAEEKLITAAMILLMGRVIKVNWTLQSVFGPSSAALRSPPSPLRGAS